MWCESQSGVFSPHKGNDKFEYFAHQLVVCFRPSFPDIIIVNVNVE